MPGDALTNRVVSYRAPDRQTFGPVADAMQPSCGTLDCHGKRERNFRMFGARGLRLDPMDTSAEGTTQDEEYDATYASLVALEPESLDAFVRRRSASAATLTLVRKGRGLDGHKGGVQMLPGDPLDRCIVTWLRGAPDADSCRRVRLAERPK
jgi:hypothetical protein